MLGLVCASFHGDLLTPQRGTWYGMLRTPRGPGPVTRRAFAAGSLLPRASAFFCVQCDAETGRGVAIGFLLEGPAWRAAAGLHVGWAWALQPGASVAIPTLARLQEPSFENPRLRRALEQTAVLRLCFFTSKMELNDPFPQHRVAPRSVGAGGDRMAACHAFPWVPPSPAVAGARPLGAGGICLCIFHGPQPGGGSQELRPAPAGSSAECTCSPPAPPTLCPQHFVAPLRSGWREFSQGEFLAPGGVRPSYPALRG